MAQTKILRDNAKFPVGTSVSLYLAGGAEFPPNAGVPAGASQATAVVAADGSLTFPNLPDFVRYFAYANVNAVDQYDRLDTYGSGAPVQAFDETDRAGRIAGIEIPGTANVFKPLTAVAIGAELTIWTPAAGKKFRITGWELSVGTAAGNVSLKDNTAGTTILVLPKAPLDTVFTNPPNMGNGILSAAANNVLTATGIATATLSGTIFGTEE